VQGTQRYVIFSFLTLGFILWQTLGRLFSTILFYAADYSSSFSNPAILGNQFTLADLLGFGIALGVGLWAYKHPKASEFSNDVVNELRKVTWPSRKETQSHTVIVIITTIIIALILGVFDLVWAELTGLIYA
jgi:preprotein translocase subunit SecE